MTIILNGEARDVVAKRLADILTETGFDEAHVATAVNEDFVPAELRGTTILADGDRLEVLAPLHGG